MYENAADEDDVLLEVEEAQGGAKGIFAYLNAYMREKKAKRDAATEALKKEGGAGALGTLNADGTPAVDDAAVAAEFSAGSVAATNDLLDCAKLAGASANQLRFEANSYLTSGADGAVYFASKTAVYRWLPYVNERENNTNNDQGKLFSAPESMQGSSGGRDRDAPSSRREEREREQLRVLEMREGQYEREIHRLERRQERG